MDFVQKIDIGSYRGINNLSLTELKQFNILTGDNNCGKTSILEVLESFMQPNDIYMWNSLTRRNTSISIRSATSFFDGIYNLFDINSDDKKIEYSIETCEKSIKIEGSISESVEEMSERQYTDIMGMFVRDDEKDELEHQSREVNSIRFEVKINGKKILNDKIYESQRFVSGRTRNINKNQEYNENILYISPIRHATGTVFLSDVLNSPELYEEMLTILKEFDENIISINYDNENENLYGQGSYKILSKNHKKALPLNVYGDGMKKAILLMSAVVKAKDGILLLDEFETAIHTSAMEKTFSWILRTCKKLNVQVFMTSHSIEAIDTVLKCCPDMQNDIRMITLVETNEGVKARNIGGTKAIQLKDEYGLELR